MFLTLYASRLKCLLRDRVVVFWTMLFPIVLATLFSLSFGNLLAEDYTFDPVKVAVTDNEAYRTDTALQQTLKALSEGDSPLLTLTVASAEQAEAALREGDVSGIITAGDSLALTVQATGLNQSILKSFVDDYNHTKAALADILQSNPQAAQQGLLEAATSHQEYTKSSSLNDTIPNDALSYFYALIAMACLYGSFWGMRNTDDIQADITALGARRSLAPTHKLQTVFSDLLASLTVHFSELLILLAYMMLALKVDFGTRLWCVVLTCLVGSFTGIAIGTFVGSALRKKEGLKVAVIITVSMVWSLFAGLMVGGLKGLIDRNVPLLNALNPAALIADTFYSLLVYDTLDRFAWNIGSLSAIALVLALGSYLLVRRQRYASL